MDRQVINKISFRRLNHVNESFYRVIGKVYNILIGRNLTVICLFILLPEKMIDLPLKIKYHSIH